MIPESFSTISDENRIIDTRSTKEEVNHGKSWITGAGRGQLLKDYEPTKGITIIT